MADAWFRGEVRQALKEADDAAVERVPHDRVVSSWRQQRAEMKERDTGQPGQG